jgi:hypothetical protein
VVEAEIKCAVFKLLRGFAEIFTVLTAEGDVVKPGVSE